MALRLIFLTASVSLLATLACCQTTPLTGRHTDIPRWCGKPYQPGYPDYEPGGMLYAPPSPSEEAIRLSIASRHSIYVDGEDYGEFLVDATTSGHTAPRSTSSNLSIEIKDDETGQILVTGNAVLGYANNVHRFDLGQLTPRLQPRNVTLVAGNPSGGKNLIRKTTLSYLPAKTTGSMVKMDNLYGGMLFANQMTDFRFKPLLPFGFYASCSGFLTSFANASVYSKLGFTGINPVCALTDEGSADIFDWLEALDMPFQYDMRGSYYNLSSVAEQVAQIKDNSALLSWYTADEPDGWQYSFDSVTAAYDYLKTVDPYHPTGLVLNCQNYHFDEYSKGADYIMEDAYPIGINATYSKWGTVCNETYGDCGCDNCVGALQDVSNRLDDYDKYNRWLGRSYKPLWTVAQAFSGEYWSRDPTPKEAWAMNLLGFNHKAKGVMNWIFPSSVALNQAHSVMAEAFTSAPIKQFLLGGHPTKIAAAGLPTFDVAYWRQGQQMMIGLVNLDYADSGNTVTLELPVPAASIANQAWGALQWTVSDGKVQVHGVPGTATSVVIVNIGQSVADQTTINTAQGYSS